MMSGWLLTVAIIRNSMVASRETQSPPRAPPYVRTKAALTEPRRDRAQPWIRLSAICALWLACDSIAVPACTSVFQRASSVDS